MLTKYDEGCTQKQILFFFFKKDNVTSVQPDELFTFLPLVLGHSRLTVEKFEVKQVPWTIRLPHGSPCAGLNRRNALDLCHCSGDVCC